MQPLSENKYYIEAKRMHIVFTFQNRTAMPDRRQCFGSNLDTEGMVTHYFRQARTNTKVMCAVYTEVFSVLLH